MNHVRSYQPTYERVTDDVAGTVMVQSFDVRDMVTEATVNTLQSNRLGLAGSIAYLDKGAELYENFKRAHSQSPADSDAARLITMYKSALSQDITDIERLIVIGGGSYDSITHQELSLIGDAGQNPKLKEVVLNDVSIHSLREQVRAVKDFSNKHGLLLKVMPILGEYQKVSPDFDLLIKEFGSAPKEKIKAALMMTGATFGNVSGVTAIDRVPRREIENQMAHLGNFVGMNSTVMFDCFTKIESGANYYNTPELSLFFNNIPVIMATHCRKLLGLHANAGPNNENFFHYRAQPLHQARMIVHELVAVSPQEPTIVNGVDRVFPIRTHDRLSLMFSLRAATDDITNVPVQNTGLESQRFVSSKNLVMYAFKKVGEPAAIFEPETTYSTTNRSSLPDATPTGAMSRIIDAGRRLIPALGSSNAAPA